MRNGDPAFPYRFLGHAAFVAGLAGLAASCSNATRFQEPLFTGSTENQRQIIGQADPSQPMPPVIQKSSAITSNELPPPPTMVSASAPATAAPIPASNPVIAANTGDYGWSAVGGQVVTVRSGETLYSLASQYGVPEKQLMSANQMRSAADVRPGRVLIIPHRVAMTGDAAIRPTPVSYTPAAAREPAPRINAPARTTTAQTHTVAPGETLYAVARRYGARVSELIVLNHLPADGSIQVGQILKLPTDGGHMTMAAASPTVPAASPAIPSAKPATPAPAPTRVASIDPKATFTNTPTAPKAEPPAAPTAGAPAVPSVPTVPVVKGGSNDTAAASAAIDRAADPGSSSGTDFRWPVRGRIIAGFGAKPNGEKNDGINLAVPEGTAVKAAEAGTVIYAGNELEGYGNLVLIRHADGWVSAYADNRDLTVKRGEQVRRGQVIAHAGMTGSVTSPQLHFELRKGAKPVNPLDYLAS